MAILQDIALLAGLALIVTVSIGPPPPPGGYLAFLRFGDRR